MRGEQLKQTGFISLIDVESLIAADHPIRAIRRDVDLVLGRLHEHFNEIYAQDGRPSIPPEVLLKAKVLQALYTVRSDRQLCDRLQTDLLFRWFVGLQPDQVVFDASTFSKNQQRLLTHEVADLFFAEVVGLARERGWVSDEHFSVDGTLIEAWASTKSFRPKGEFGGPGAGNPWKDFTGQPRSNDTHQSTTDPEAKLVRKSDGDRARLCFGAHAVMENRHGLCVLFSVRPAVGAPEAEVAVDGVQELINRDFTPRTVGADRGYHTRQFIEELRELNVEPHPALMPKRDPVGVVINTAHRISQVYRRRIEEIFGWIKTTGNLRKTRYRGVARTHAGSQYVVAACNLVRMAKLALSPPPMLRA